MAEGNTLGTPAKIKLGVLTLLKKKKFAKLTSIIHAKDIAGLKSFIKSGWDINQLFPHNVPSDSDKRSPSDLIAPIHLAIDVGWLEGIKFLLEAGADVNLRDFCDGKDSSAKIDWRGYSPLKLMFTPLMRAVWLWPRPNSLEIVKFLLENGADPNLRCPNTDQTPITVAVKCRNLPAVDLLLTQYNVDVTGMIYEDIGAKTDIISFACGTILPGGCSDSWIYLQEPGQFFAKSFHEKRNYNLEGDYDYNHERDQPFFFEGLKLIKDLVLHGAVVNPHLFDILDHLQFRATPEFHPHILDFLFKHGIDINEVKDECTILSKAVSRFSHSNYIRWLIRHGASTNIGCRKAFMSSLVARNYDLLELLINAGVIFVKGDRYALEQILLNQNVGSVYEIEYNKYRTAASDDEGELNLNSSVNWNPTHVEAETFLESDLLEFSDDTLCVYPKASCWKFDNLHHFQFLQRIGLYEADEDANKILKLSTEEVEQIKNILNFLSQPPELKWRCRQWIRRNLVSLSPCLVKSLPLPSALKRYILCHEL